MDISEKLLHILENMLLELRMGADEVTEIKRTVQKIKVEYGGEMDDGGVAERLPEPVTHW